MDMVLYKCAYEPQAIAGFKSTEDMAKYFRQFLQVILPEEYKYHKEEWHYGGMVTHRPAKSRLLVKGYARSSRASVAYFRTVGLEAAIS